MRASGTNREELIAAAGEENGIVTHLPADHASLGNIGQRDALRKIGPLRLGLLCCHGALLTVCRKLSSWMTASPIDKCRR
jgi:hypothetical protein